MRPAIVSTPALPSSTLFASFPQIVLASSLPWPSIAAAPSRSRFSTLADSVCVTVEYTHSVPAPTPSTILSPTLSTWYVSLPAPPSIVSAPAPPLMTLLPLLPFSTLFRLLPVALLLPTPVSVRFSTQTSPASDQLIDESTRSVPAKKFSVTLSSTLSTT